MSLSSLETHDVGITWVIDEKFSRASHALLDAGSVWFIDPVDDPEAMEQVAGLGTPAAVVQLLDRHNRDCAAIARRLGVPHLSVPTELPGAPFTIFPVIDRWRWREAALWWPERQALVVAEALGTNPLFTANSAPVGVHPMLRLFPPRALAATTRCTSWSDMGPPVTDRTRPTS